MSIKNSFFRSRVWQRLMTVFMTLVMMFGGQATFLTQNAQASSDAAPLLLTNMMSLRVQSATDGTNIPDYQYIINVDNTGVDSARYSKSSSVTALNGIFSSILARVIASPTVSFSEPSVAAKY